MRVSVRVSVRRCSKRPAGAPWRGPVRDRRPELLKEADGVTVRLLLATLALCKVTFAAQQRVQLPGLNLRANTSNMGRLLPHMASKKVQRGEILDHSGMEAQLESVKRAAVFSSCSFCWRWL